jgi:coenzyme F420-0:L-glutamate ligase/coenzyme F420-1:gamma-L-glutamate ligase
MKNRIEVIGLENFPLINKGDRISDIILEVLEENQISLKEGDIILIAQSIVSKSLGDIVNLDEVKVSKRAFKIYENIKSKAKKLGIPEKQPELIQLILDQSKEIVASEHVLITETKQGFVCANAGIDKSNVEGKRIVSLLPEDPDKEAQKLRKEIEKKTKKNIAVIITDSFGRPFRIGSVGVAIGISNIKALIDKRGSKDLFGNELKSTIIAQIDNLASAAQLVMGETDEGIPVVILRGFRFEKDDKSSIQEIIRNKESDLFRLKNLNICKNILARRVSYKSEFANEEVDKEIILKCIKIATFAPNAHNNQCWRYIIIDRNNTRKKLIDKMNEKLKRDLIEDHKSKKFIEMKIKKTRKNFQEAPYLVILCLDSKDLEKYPDKDRSNAEYLMGIQSVSASATYLLIAFEIAGLASCWYCAPLFSQEIIRDILNLPKTYQPMAFFTVGYPKKISKKPPRKDLEEIIFKPDIKEDN